METYNFDGFTWADIYVLDTTNEIILEILNSPTSPNIGEFVEINKNHYEVKNILHKLEKCESYITLSIKH